MNDSPATVALMASMNEEPFLSPCPFCGFWDHELDDALHPTGRSWIECGPPFMRKYFNWKEREPHHNLCYEMNCVESSGGCGARIEADSLEECIARWNRRPSIEDISIIPDEYDK